MVSYGHSWVAGEGASSRSSGFAALTAQELGLSLENRAVSGSDSRSTAELMSDAPPPPAPLYLVMTGLNDLRLHGDDPSGLSLYAAALRRILTILRRTSPHSSVVAVAQPYLADFSLHAPHNRGSNPLIDRYNSVLRRTAAGYSRVGLAEPDDWDPGFMLSEDTVHPNDAGHAWLARAAVQTAARHGAAAHHS